MPHRTWLAATLLTTTGAAAWAQPTEYVCTRTTGTMAIDAVLDEPAWAQADAIDGFMTLGPKGEKVRNKTRVRLLFDDELLYLGGDLATLPGKMPHTIEEAGRDRAVWGNDCIDVFLQPRESQPVTYQLMVSAHGQLYDGKNAPGNTKPKAWNGAIEVKTKQRLGGWSFEMSVPFADLGHQPFKGDVWVLRLGLAADGYELAMWPHNRERSFHNKSCRAYLIFEDRDLLAAGDFETPPTKGRDVPPGWRLVPAKPGGGSIRAVTLPDAPRGPRVVEIDKTAAPTYFPALLFEHIPVEPGATYELSAYVKAEKPFYAGLTLAGPETKDPTQRLHVRGERHYPASPVFREITARYRVDKRMVEAAVVMRYQRGIAKMWIDGVRLTRVNGLSLSGQVQQQADPIHNLVALSVRTGFKPFWLLKRPDGWYRNERTIFKDSGTGATIWKMSRHPGFICRHQYMQFSPWSCNGERLALCSLPQWWRIFMEVDGGAWTPAMETGSSIWDRLDPDTLWCVRRGNEVVKHNVATGETLAVKTFRGHITLWPMSQDGRYLLAGQNLPVDGKTTSRIHLIPRDVEPGGAGIITVDPGEQIHQLWFTNRPDHSMSFSYEAYLRGGAVMTPDGRTVKRLERGMIPGGHAAPSRSGKWAVNASGFIYDWLTGETVWLSDHDTNHQSWGPDDTWFVGSSGYDLRRFGVEPRFDQLLGSSNSRMKYNNYWSEVHPTVSPDGTKLAYASNMLGYVEFYVLIMRLPEAPLDLKAQPALDGVRLEWRPPEHAKEFALYRIHRAKSVAGPYVSLGTVPASETRYACRGRADWHFVVTSQEHSGLESGYSNAATATPRRGPLLSSAEAESGSYNTPGEEIFDATAANLYGVSLGADSPCDGLTMRVPLPHVARGGRPLMIFARVRNGLAEGEGRLALHVGGREAGTVAVKERAWHWLKLSPAARQRSRPSRDGGIEPEIKARNRRRMRPFVEVSQRRDRAQDPVAAGQHFFDGLLEALRLQPRSLGVKLVPLDAGIAVDQIVVVDDPKLVPKTFWGKDHRASEPVAHLSAQPIDSYAIRLTWTPPKGAQNIAHYNVYAARGSSCKPGNETLIVSPAEPEVVDWGLMAGTTYTYRVTAIDRAGNESAPSEALSATTPAVEDRVFIRCPCAVRTKGQARLETPIGLDAASEVVLWVKARCFNQNPVARFKVLLDGRELRKPFQIPWHFVTPHHPGPATGVWLWSCIDKPFEESEDGKRRLLPVSAGPHTLTLAPDVAFNKHYGDIDVEFGEVLVTNDLGYIPPGITNFLIDPARGRRELASR